MSRYIDADKLNLYDNLFMSEDTINKSGVYVRYRAVENLIKNAPAADVQKVRHGKWLPLRFTLECSECGNSFAERNITIYDKRTDTLAYAYFCPICGAMMD